MEEEKLSPTKTSETNTVEDEVQHHWQDVVKRRSFLKGIGIAGATLSAATLLVANSNAESDQRRRLSKGDVALLQFALWAETVESDLWTQYAVLGGVGPSGGGAAQASEE